MSRSNITKGDLYDISHLIMYNYESLQTFFKKGYSLSNEKFDELMAKKDAIPKEKLEYDFFEFLSFDKLFIISSVIIIHSNFEVLLKKICEKCFESKGKNFSSPHNNIIETCKIKLDSELNLISSESELRWSKIRAYTKVRNSIVHNNCQIEKQNDFDIVSALEHLTVDENKIISKIEPEYIKNKLNDCCDILLFYNNKIIS